MDDHETGRYLVALGRRPVRASLDELRRLGVREVATSSDVRTAGGSPAHAPALLLERLGVAVLSAPPAPAGPSSAGHRPRPQVERERWVRVPEPVLTATADGSTWGLEALGVGSGLDGGQVRVAVLDTGVDAGHPAFARSLTGTTSLLPEEDAGDLNGHGTHCAGTVCGDVSYAVAPGARLWSGKVLDRHGVGREADVLAGSEWAVDQGCRVVSLSLASPGDGGPSTVFEQVAAELLDEGVVLVAASGNDSDRARGRVAPVGRPASCPSVVAVGAVGRDLAVAPFSNGGAALDLVAPGVDVRSAWPGGGAAVLDGTSMAAPHVAGVVALLMQAHPDLPARALVARLLAQARALPGGRDAVGAGLVQRP